MPSVAVYEPLALCLRIMEDRAFVRATEYIEVTAPGDLKLDSPMKEIAWDIKAELLHAR